MKIETEIFFLMIFIKKIADFLILHFFARRMSCLKCINLLSDLSDATDNFIKKMVSHCMCRFFNKNINGLVGV